MMEKIGIVAGNGNMPAEVIERCEARGLRPFVIGLKPFVDASKLGVAAGSAGVSGAGSAGVSGGSTGGSSTGAAGGTVAGSGKVSGAGSAGGSAAGLDGLAGGAVADSGAGSGKVSAAMDGSAADSDKVSGAGSGDQKLPSGGSVRVVRLGQVGRMVDFLRANGVRKVMMAGGTPRAEALREIRRHGLDRTALGMLFRLGWKLLTKGNAAVFKAVLAEADRLGLNIVGVQDVLPEMVVGEGVITAARPSEADLADIRVGIEAALDLGRRDIGQAVAVLDGVVLATEDARGTDATLRRAVEATEDTTLRRAVEVTDTTLRRARDASGEAAMSASDASHGGSDTRASGRERAAAAGSGRVRRPVMVKFPSPGQDLRVDFPALGTDTIEALARNGFAGVAVETGGALIIDRQAVIDAADRAGLFIIGISRDRG